MQVTVVGGCFIALGIFFAIWRREWYPGLLAASAPFVATAAITFGSGSVPPFYVLAIGAIALTVWRGLRGRWPNRRLALLMGVFFAVALLPTVVAPFIFAGTPVLDPRAGIDDQVLNPTPLAFTSSMGAQVVYLLLAICVVLYLSSTTTVTFKTLLPAALSANIASFLAFIPWLQPLMDALFRNYSSAAYNPYEERHYGTFPEPSYLAVYAMAVLAYALFSVRLLRGPSRWLAVLAAALAVVNLVGSASGTALMTLAVLALVATAWLIVSSVRRGDLRKLGRHLAPYWGKGLARRSVFVAGMIIGSVTIVTLTALLATWAVSQMLEKSLTLSFANRTRSDVMAFESLLRTWFFGTGLGSSRPSGLFAMIASNIGVLGLTAFLVICVAALVAVWRSPQRLPVITTLVTLIVAKGIAEPSLSTPLLWVLFGVCFAMGAVPRRLPVESASASPAAGAASRST